MVSIATAFIFLMEGGHGVLLVGSLQYEKKAPQLQGFLNIWPP